MTFAGVPSDTGGERVNKNFEVIAPEGDCVLRVDGETFNFAEGEAAVVPPKIRHYFEGKAVFVTIDKALIPLREIAIIKDDNALGIAHAARQARLYYNSDINNKEGVLAALGELITAYIVAFYGKIGLSPVAETVRATVEKNLSDPTFSLKESLKKLPLNYDYVRKMFKAETGLTPHEYLLERRMKLARDLIANGMGNRYSGYSVAQVAEACGFMEPLYFSRVFKKYFGMSPTDFYRENGRK